MQRTTTTIKKKCHAEASSIRKKKATRTGNIKKKDVSTTNIHSYKRIKRKKKKRAAHVYSYAC